MKKGTLKWREVHWTQRVFRGDWQSLRWNVYVDKISVRKSKPTRVLAKALRHEVIIINT